MRVSIVPAAEAVHLVVKEIHHVARVYSLFDVAQILLAGRERYHLQFTVSDKVGPILKSKVDSSLWLTKEEAIAHFWHSPAAKDLYESEEIETDPPAGNFQVVARCGIALAIAFWVLQVVQHDQYLELAENNHQRALVLRAPRGVLFDRNGNAGPTVWVDGAVVGGWVQRPDGTLAIKLLADVGRQARAAVEAEAHRVEALVGPARFRVRFPAPLQAELLA